MRAEAFRVLDGFPAELRAGPRDAGAGLPPALPACFPGHAPVPAAGRGSASLRSTPLHRHHGAYISVLLRLVLDYVLDW